MRMGALNYLRGPGAQQDYDHLNLKPRECKPPLGDAMVAEYIVLKISKKIHSTDMQPKNTQEASLLQYFPYICFNPSTYL